MPQAELAATQQQLAAARAALQRSRALHEDVHAAVEGLLRHMLGTEGQVRGGERGMIDLSLRIYRIRIYGVS